MIKIYDTKSRTKRTFKPVREGKIGIYVCGPTVYNYIHIGNARTFISFDTIRRYLMWRGYEVTFVQNVTDVDDKIIAKALEEGRSAQEVAQEYTEAFISDMHDVEVLDPDIRPKATEEIEAMIDLVEKLIENGHAYVADGDVYFSVRSYPGYGELSNRNVDEMESGHRALRSEGQGLEDRKRDPLDFALWKAAKPDEPSWSSPWGEGRPGWHIECSTMSEKYLGLPFDIHGGGADLVFPHHENERAQSEAAFGTTFANYWMHGGMLQINSEKMSKSLGNFLLLRDILTTTDAAVLRMLMLQTHYRSPLDFSDSRLNEAEASLDRLKTFVTNTLWLADNANDAATSFDKDTVESLMQETKKSFCDAMDDDFNTAGALGAIFSFVGEMNSLLDKATFAPDSVEILKKAALTVKELLGVLGISLDQSDGSSDASADGVIAFAAEVAGFEGSSLEDALEALLSARAQARAEKNYQRADQIRDGLAELGFKIEDTPKGARILAL